MVHGWAHTFVYCTQRYLTKDIQMGYLEPCVTVICRARIEPNKIVGSKLAQPNKKQQQQQQHLQTGADILAL